MNRAEFEHVIAAAASALGEEAFVVIGSQAILGPHPDAPDAMLRSAEVDIFPREHPERAIEVDGSMGDGSRFHEAFGYYAHGVGPETAKAPHGWEKRLVAVAIPPRPGSELAPVAYCLETHDLVLAKCAAARERDWEFAAAALAAGLVRVETLAERIPSLPLDDERRRGIETRLRSLANP